MTANKDHILWKTDKLWLAQGDDPPTSLAREGEVDGRPTFLSSDDCRLIFTGFWIYVKLGKINWMVPTLKMRSLEKQLAKLHKDKSWIITTVDDNNNMVRLFSDEAKLEMDRTTVERKFEEEAVRKTSEDNKRADAEGQARKGQIILSAEKVTRLEVASIQTTTEEDDQKVEVVFNRSFECWTAEEVSAWVKGLAQSYQSYGKLFVEEGIDGESLVEGDWKEADLVEIGVERVHARRIMRKARKFIEEGQGFSKDSSPTVSTVCLDSAFLMKRSSNMLLSLSSGIFSSQISVEEVKEEKILWTNLFSPNFLSKLIELAETHKGVHQGLIFIKKESEYIRKLKTSPNNPSKNLNGFLSHVQKFHGNFCRSVSFALKQIDCPCWYDKNAKRLDVRGMIEGVANSNEFLVFMVREYFDREWCVFEYLVARIFGKSITIVLELKEEYGGLSVDKLQDFMPELFLSTIDTYNDVVKISRDYFESMVEKIKKRATRHRLEEKS